MTYRIEFERRAQKTLSRLETETRIRLMRAISNLATNPRPTGAKKLVGSDEWRIRIGDYRVIYSINDGVLLVVVIRLGHRREIYER